MNANRPWLWFYRISNGTCSGSMLLQTGSIRALWFSKWSHSGLVWVLCETCSSPMISQTGSVRVLCGTCPSPKERFRIAETQNTRTNRWILARYELEAMKLTLRAVFWFLVRALTLTDQKFTLLLWFLKESVSSKILARMFEICEEIRNFPQFLTLGKWNAWTWKLNLQFFRNLEVKSEKVLRFFPFSSESTWRKSNIPKVFLGKFLCVFSKTVLGDFF